MQVWDIPILRENRFFQKHPPAALLNLVGGGEQRSWEVRNHNDTGWNPSLGTTDIPARSVACILSSWMIGFVGQLVQMTSYKLDKVYNRGLL